MFGVRCQKCRWSLLFRVFVKVIFRQIPFRMFHANTADIYTLRISCTLHYKDVLVLQDIPSYRLLNVGECLEYFYISPDTGAIYLRKALYVNPTNQYVVSTAF